MPLIQTFIEHRLCLSHHLTIDEGKKQRAIEGGVFNIYYNPYHRPFGVHINILMIFNILNYSQQQVCLAHNENDPAQRDRCLVNAASRSDTSPDVRPMDLPVRNGQMGD